MEGENLLVHLGGLGDVCLSESVFLSLRQHLGRSIVALGYKGVLDLFSDYFLKVDGIESRRWLYLFSESMPGETWDRIVFIGKDAEGLLTDRWRTLAKNEVIFIDMYHEDAYRPRSTALEERDESRPLERHIEGYQLLQLGRFGIEPCRKQVLPKRSERIILYPEKGYRKKKWPVENFLTLYHSLKAEGRDVVLMEPPDLSTGAGDSVFFEDLRDVKSFFSDGGIFVSNDSGMAHLAGSLGLFTITIFTDFDPQIWHPRGRNISLKSAPNQIDVASVEEKIREALLSIASGAGQDV